MATGIKGEQKREHTTGFSNTESLLTFGRAAEPKKVCSRRARKGVGGRELETTSTDFFKAVLLNKETGGAIAGKDLELRKFFASLYFAFIFR